MDTVSFRAVTSGAARRAAGGRAPFATALVVLCAVGAAGLLRFADATEELGDDLVIFGNAAGLPFLESVLQSTSAARERLDELVACLPVWRLNVTERDAPFGTQRYDVSFDFAPPRRGTGRVYRVSTTLESTQERPPIAVVERSESWQTAPVGIVEPAFSQTVCFEILRLAAASPDFARELDDWVSVNPLVPLLQLTLVPSEPDAPGEFRLGLYRGGYAGDSGTEARYWVVEYDPGGGGFAIYDEEGL